MSEIVNEPKMPTKISPFWKIFETELYLIKELSNGLSKTLIEMPLKKATLKATYDISQF